MFHYLLQFVKPVFVLCRNIDDQGGERGEEKSANSVIAASDDEDFFCSVKPMNS